MHPFLGPPEPFDYLPERTGLRKPCSPFRPGIAAFTPPRTRPYSRWASNRRLSPKMPRPFSKLSAALLLLLAGLHIFCPSVSHAEDLNKIAPSGYVIDLAGVLDPNAK